MNDSGGTKPSGIFVIAEVGSNFAGDLDLARQYVHLAKECGADAVKFQTLKRETLVAPRIWCEGRIVDNPTYDKFSNIGLPDEWHHPLQEEAAAAGVEFFSTPFDLDAVALMEQIGTRIYKIASGDLTFAPLLRAVGRTRKRVIMSTGASTLDEIGTALGILREAGASDITLLHCVSNYPPAWEEVNVRAIVALRGRFALPVGISDHTPGHVVPVAAAVLGATVVEKHLTMDRATPGPDHPFAMLPEEFAEMVRSLRLVERVLGSGTKEPTQSEIADRWRMRRGVYDPVTLDPISGSEGLWLRPENPGLDPGK